MEMTKKNDFVEIEYTGISQGTVFDSNQPEEVSKLNPKAEAKPLILVIGQKMVVRGLDSALEGKQIGKKYEVVLQAKDAFGERKRELVKTIPLKVFSAQQISPYPGLVLAMDNMLAKIITVSGARVITDFNNPLAGKDVTYSFLIKRRVEDEKEKAECLFSAFFKTVPEFSIGEKIIIKGDKNLEIFAKVFGERFKELIGKELVFEAK